MASEVEHARTRPALSERQRQVARALERGLSNEEIAAELGIAPRTVKAHCDSLPRPGRTQLAAARRASGAGRHGRGNDRAAAGAAAD
jgi:DNA-binding NarL/FixJ family response regulator